MEQALRMIATPSNLELLEAGAAQLAKELRLQELALSRKGRVGLLMTTRDGEVLSHVLDALVKALEEAHPCSRGIPWLCLAARRTFRLVACARASGAMTGDRGRRGGGARTKGSAGGASLRRLLNVLCKIPLVISEMVRDPRGCADVGSSFAVGSASSGVESLWQTCRLAFQALETGGRLFGGFGEYGEVAKGCVVGWELEGSRVWASRCLSKWVREEDGILWLLQVGHTGLGVALPGGGGVVGAGGGDGLEWPLDGEVVASRVLGVFGTLEEMFANSGYSERPIPLSGIVGLVVRVLKVGDAAWNGEGDVSVDGLTLAPSVASKVFGRILKGACQLLRVMVEREAEMMVPFADEVFRVLVDCEHGFEGRWLAMGALIKKCFGVGLRDGQIRLLVDRLRKVFFGGGEEEEEEVLLGREKKETKTDEKGFAEEKEHFGGIADFRWISWNDELCEGVELCSVLVRHCGRTMPNALRQELDRTMLRLYGIRDDAVSREWRALCAYETAHSQWSTSSNDIAVAESAATTILSKTSSTPQTQLTKPWQESYDILSHFAAVSQRNPSLATHTPIPPTSLHRRFHSLVTSYLQLSASIPPQNSKTSPLSSLFLPTTPHPPIHPSTLPVIPASPAPIPSTSPEHPPPKKKPLRKFSSTSSPSPEPIQQPNPATAAAEPEQTYHDDDDDDASIPDIIDE